MISENTIKDKKLFAKKINKNTNFVFYFESKMKIQIDKLWNFFVVILNNKSIIVISLFIIWISFLDTHNLIDRFKNLQKLNSLKKELNFFKTEIDKYNTQYTELFSNTTSLEKFAREQYIMKQEDEDIFIILPE